MKHLPNNKNITLGQLQDFAEKADVRLDALETAASNHQTVINGLTEKLNSGELNGADGYTPVKGTDYWTETDKAEMVSEVLAALPAAEGVSF